MLIRSEIQYIYMYNSVIDNQPFIMAHNLNTYSSESYLIYFHLLEQSKSVQLFFVFFYTCLFLKKTQRNLSG